MRDAGKGIVVPTKPTPPPPPPPTPKPPVGNGGGTPIGNGGGAPGVMGGGYTPPNPPPVDPAQPEEGKSKTGLIVLLLCLLLVAGLGLGAFLIFGGGGDDGGSDSSENILNNDSLTESVIESAPDDTSSPDATQDVSDAISENDSSQAIVEVDKAVKALTIEKAPTKTAYRIGEMFDCSGLELKAVYEDGSSEIVKEDFVYETVVFENAGEQSVKVSYGGQTVDVKVTVEALAISSISIVGYPNTYYSVGQSLNTTGLALNVVYSDGSEETVTSGFTCTPTTFNTSGDIEVKVRYGDKETSFTVTVSAVTVKSISIKSSPTKTSYYKNDTLNTSGLVLTVNYSDGSSETVTRGFSCTPTVLSKVGNSIPVTVSYGGKTTSFSVKVQDIKPTSISIKTMPKYVTYYVGDTLNTSGLTLSVKYNNGETETVTKGFTCTPTALEDESNAYKITVKYSGLSTSFNVRVLPISATSISVSSKPTKTSYTVGDTLNTSGLKLTVKYSNGTSKVISAGFTCDPKTLNTAGDAVKITVKYSGLTTSFTVKVSPKAVVTATKITIKSNPSKTSYTVGDSLNTSGLTLTVEYSDGTTKTVSNGFSCSPTTLNTAGSAVKITVSYEGLTTSFNVEVKPKQGVTWNLSAGTLTISGSGAMNNYTSSSTSDWRAYKDQIKRVVIKDGITSIGNFAFYECKSLTSVTIASTVTTIGNSSFYGCAFTSISIPSSVRTIGEHAFCYCSNLTSVVIPSSVTSIGYGAFSRCNKLASVTIPVSVTNIGGYAFSNCSALNSIVYKGTKTQWNSITKGSNWNKNSAFTGVSCSNGTVSVS